jgi:hypothetical protein
MTLAGRIVVAALIFIYFLNISLLWRATHKSERGGEKRRNAEASSNIGGASR